MPGILWHSDRNERNFESDCYSSGSEHEAMASSLFLEEMVNDFMEEECRLSGCCNGDPSPVNASAKSQDLADELRDFLLHQRSSCSGDLQKLAADVERSKDRAGKIVTPEAENPEQQRLRCTAANLRSMGYNAAVCKSRWSQSKGISKGEYAYIDVLLDAGSKRVIIDTDFSSQFVIARPSDEYQAILAEIPPVFVGSEDELHKFLHLISLAMKRSLKAQSLTLPPWRRPDYLTAKWFSPYRRTTNPLPTPAPAPSRQQSDWTNSFSSDEIDRSKRPASSDPRSKKSPGLATLLAEAGMIRQETHQLVTVAT
ncbi:uncharacterized protein LOC9630264 [Selaginella moellendorffii]|nr:uncharacterized protein LOC9630264 [Selaginella moellendorffii]|eukprot:XP_002987613.2 uncharacterized protein LOC9630264 [Selaginella moellendorffii]